MLPAFLLAPFKRFLVFLLVGVAAPSFSFGEQVHPSEIEFRRQAVKRLIFNQSEAIPMSSLDPAGIVDLDLMHPEMTDAASLTTWSLKDGVLKSVRVDGVTESMRWVGSFNPFATYDLKIQDAEGTGVVETTFRDSSNGDSLTASLHFEKGEARSISWATDLNGKSQLEDEWPLPEEISIEGLTMRVQMAAVGANLFVESKGKTHLIGYVDFSERLDLRDTTLIRRLDFSVGCLLTKGATVSIAQASSSLTPGFGQADIRAITDEEGTPLLDDGRLWFTVTIRGRALPHPTQGVFSLNPSVFDLKFEGLIVFDMGDGLLRNELASHLFRDTGSGEWRGWTTGFSALGESGRNEEKTILAVSSKKDPRRGYSIMTAKPVGISGEHEDPHGVYDRKTGKWRLLLCERHEKYRAGMWESDHWDKGYKRLAGPVEMDSTGTMIQQFGDQRYVLFGSADRKVYVATYPDLIPEGELKIHMPPWNEDNGTRIWPNVIPLPTGYPAPYLALMMDRVNFPGMPKPNWTYGALYLYHGYPTELK